MVRLIRFATMLALLLFVGCSEGSPMLPPAYGFDKYPVIYGKDVDADTNDEMYIADWDTGSAAFERQQIGTDDFLQGQWLAQHNGIVWLSTGKWGVVALENTGDVELWLNADAGWTMDGAWALADDDTSLNSYTGKLDVTNKQDGIYAQSVYLNWFTIYPLGANNWLTTAVGTILKSGHCITTGTELMPHAFGMEYGGIFHLLDNLGWYSTIATGTIYTTSGDNPQITVDVHNNCWVYSMSGTTILNVGIFPPINDLMIFTAGQFVEENILTLTAPPDCVSVLTDYDACTNFNDNTQHIVTTHYIFNTVTEVSDWYLTYYRHVEGQPWVSYEVDTWQFIDNKVHIKQLDGTFPQLSIDPYNNIVIYYLEAIDDATRDLRSWTLPNIDNEYYEFDTGLGWVQYTDIDNSIDDVRFAITLPNHPI